MDAWRTSSSSIFAAVAAGSSAIPALFTGRDLLHSVGGGLAWVVTGIGSVAMARGIRRRRRFFRCFNEPTLQVLYVALFRYNLLIICSLHRLASTRNGRIINQGQRIRPSTTNAQLFAHWHPL